jgi:hypothetical protein
MCGNNIVIDQNTLTGGQPAGRERDRVRMPAAVGGSPAASILESSVESLEPSCPAAKSL